MGSLTAMGFAEAVAANDVSLDAALRYHLLSNHYPPLPVALVPVARAAIEAAHGGDWDRLVDLPDEMQFRDRTDGKVQAHLAIETMHLEAFLADAVDWED